MLYPLSYEGKGDERSAPPLPGPESPSQRCSRSIRFEPTKGCRVG